MLFDSAGLHKWIVCFCSSTNGYYQIWLLYLCRSYEKMDLDAYIDPITACYQIQMGHGSSSPVQSDQDLIIWHSPQLQKFAPKDIIFHSHALKATTETKSISHKRCFLSSSAIASWSIIGEWFKIHFMNMATSPKGRCGMSSLRG